MKKVKLAVKKRFQLKVAKRELKEIYYSGFCATDNNYFALFNVSEQFLVDKGFNSVLNFKLSEDDLWMLIDRKNEITCSKGSLKVSFNNYGLVERKNFDLLCSLSPSISFYPVIEWFGTASNRLIVGLPDREGKPIGVLKTVT